MVRTFGPEYSSDTCGDGPTFVVDTGATQHMVTPDVLMTDMSPSNTPIQVAGGNCLVSCLVGTVGPLADVLCVEGLVVNLLSVSQASKLGFTFEFSPVEVKMFRKCTPDVIYCGKLIKGLYYLTFPSTQTSLHTTAITALVASAEPVNAFAMWHARLGHISNKILYNMFVHKQHVSGFGPHPFTRADKDSFAQSVCVGCVLGAQTMAPVSRKDAHADRATTSTPTTPTATTTGSAIFNRGKLVAVDLLTSSVTSVGGSSFALVMVDRESRYLWSYPLRSKEAGVVKAAFDLWILRMRTEGIVVEGFTTIRSDNGREFINSTIHDLFL